MSDYEHIANELAQLRADMRQFAVVRNELTLKWNRLAKEFLDATCERDLERQNLADGG